MGNISINHKLLSNLASEQGIRFVILHGSHATNSAREDSDVDIALYLEPERLESFGYRTYTATLEGVAKALGVSADRVDLVTLNTANILLRYEITSKGKLLCGDEDAYAQYCAFAFRDYIDAKPIFDLESAMIEKRHALIQNHVAA